MADSLVTDEQMAVVGKGRQTVTHVNIQPSDVRARVCGVLAPGILQRLLIGIT